MSFSPARAEIEGFEHSYGEIFAKSKRRCAVMIRKFVFIRLTNNAVNRGVGKTFMPPDGPQSSGGQAFSPSRQTAHIFLAREKVGEVRVS
jgi:hypothetical protein